MIHFLVTITNAMVKLRGIEIVIRTNLLDILRQPPDPFSITCTASLLADIYPISIDCSRLTLPHNNATHENLDRPDTFQWHLALPCCLPQT